MSRLVIIGGSDAGISAALRAREFDAGSEVTVVVADRFPNYSICGLPFYLSGEVPDWRQLAHRTEEEITGKGIHLLLNHTAKTIDTANREVTVMNSDWQGNQLRYERLIIATVGTQLSVIGSQGFQIAADLVLVAVGVQPQTEVAKSAGITLGLRDAIRITRAMETNVPDIFAAGDCVETWHRLLNQPTYLPLGTTAHKQGRIAGENALGGHQYFAGTLGTQVVKVFETVVARTGLRDDEARNAGFDPLTVESTNWDHKVYYPGAHPLCIRVTGDRQSGRLLGAQMVGHWHTEVAKRIDVFATALFQGMLIDDLNHLDLSYTPPVSSPWDPIQTSAQAWVRAQESSHDVVRTH